MAIWRKNRTPEQIEKMRKSATKRAQENRAKNKEREIEKSLRRKYGVTLSEFREIFERQNGRCAICECPLADLTADGKTRRAVHVDHCHSSRKIRGVLCRSCNMGIGIFKDSAERLTKAASYLIQSS